MSLILSFDQWWVWDKDRECYIEVPIEVLDELKNYKTVDEQYDRLWEICCDNPDWFYDEERCYDEDYDI